MVVPLNSRLESNKEKEEEGWGVDVDGVFFKLGDFDDSPHEDYEDHLHCQVDQEENSRVA